MTSEIVFNVSIGAIVLFAVIAMSSALFLGDPLTKYYKLADDHEVSLTITTSNKNDLVLVVAEKGVFSSTFKVLDEGHTIGMYAEWAIKNVLKKELEDVS